MNSKNYISPAQARIIKILKDGGWIYLWNEDRSEVEINNQKPPYKIERETFDIRTFNILKDKEIIYKLQETDLYQIWIIKSGRHKKGVIR